MQHPLEITHLIDGVPLWVLAFPLAALAVAITFIIDYERLTLTYIITVLIVLLAVFIGIQNA